MTKVSVSALLICFLACEPIQAFSSLSHRITERGSRLFQTSSGDAIATLDASQKSSMASILAAIPELTAKPDLSWAPGTTQILGCAASLAAYDAPGQGNVAWMSDLCIDGGMSSLTIFNGPLTCVPHLLSRCTVVNGGAELQLNLDFRPRAYGAYELVDEAGNYPGPDTLGRKAFEYSGNRKEFESKFFTDEVQAFVQDSINSFQGARVKSDMDGLTEEEKLTMGPLAISAIMPVTAENVAAIAATREKAASYWLGWALDSASHQHRPGAPVNTQYVYDTKFKLNAYGALLSTYSQQLSPTDGAILAAAESGPLDEAYVGGGS